MKNNDAGFTSQQRSLVQKEINERKVDIDRSVFKKTPEEKKELKRLKSKLGQPLVD